MFSGLSDLAPLPSGKKIHGLPCKPRTTQPAENRPSASDGRTSPSSTTTSSSMPRTRNSLPRSPITSLSPRPSKCPLHCSPKSVSLPPLRSTLHLNSSNLCRIFQSSLDSQSCLQPLCSSHCYPTISSACPQSGSTSCS